MIESLISLVTYTSFGGGAIGTVFAQWEASGMFTYILPFLLIFAVVFGILTQTNIFKDNRAINGIIALVVALMSLQFNFVSVFFSEIFPRFGVGLIIILIAMILLGMFAPNRTWMTYTFFGIAAITLVVVLINSAGAVGWMAGGFLGNIYWPDVLPWAVIIIAIAVIIGASVPKKDSQDVSSNFMKAITGQKD